MATAGARPMRAIIFESGTLNAPPHKPPLRELAPSPGAPASSTTTERPARASVSAADSPL